MADPLKSAPMTVLVRGKVTRHRRHEIDGVPLSLTAITTPAADEYSKPQIVEVRSPKSLAPVGDVVEVVCHLGGYARKAFDAKDDDGVVTRVIPINLTLDAVAA